MIRISADQVSPIGHIGYADSIGELLVVHLQNLLAQKTDSVSETEAFSRTIVLRSHLVPSGEYSCEMSVLCVKTPTSDSVHYLSVDGYILLRGTGPSLAHLYYLLVPWSLSFEPSISQMSQVLIAPADHHYTNDQILVIIKGLQGS